MAYARDDGKLPDVLVHVGGEIILIQLLTRAAARWAISSLPYERRSRANLIELDVSDLRGVFLSLSDGAIDWELVQ